MSRICCTVGTWQLLTLVAALRHAAAAGHAPAAGASEDVLVVYETHGVPEAFQQALLRMAETAWPWARVVPAYGLLDNARKLAQGAFDDLLATLRARIGLPVEEVDALWCCWLNRPAEKKLFAAYPRARLVLYEDGLVSYLPLHLASALDPGARGPGSAFRRWQARRWPARRLRQGGSDVDPAHLARLAAVYLQVDAGFPPPALLAGVPCHRVPVATLGAVLAQVGATLALPVRSGPAAPDRPRVLLLGQALSRNGVMPRAEELALYREVARTVLAKGYGIVWKEHPRVSEGFAAELAADAAARTGDAAALRELALPHAYPVELVAAGLGLAAVVAGTSVAPFFLRSLFGIPGYSFADALLPCFERYGKAADAHMGRLVCAALPPLAALPPAPVSPAAAAGQAPGRAC